MSLSDVLNNLTGARDALVTAINGKGGTVATTATLRQCAEAVTALPEGGGGGDEIPGQIFYASFAEDTDRAESGQKLEKYNSPTFVTEDGIKCVKLENSAIYTRFPCFYGDTPFTVSFWGKAPEAITNEFHILWAGENKTYGKVHFEIVAGKFGISDSQSFFYTENVVTGSFHHFLVTYDGNKLSAYVDNAFATQSGNFTANISLSNMFVGKTVDVIENGPFFIANLRILTRALSAYEISTLYDEFVNRDNPNGGGSSGGGATSADLIDLIERDITSIEIPVGTTEIGYGAFSQCSSLNSVSIPDGVTKISQYAFSGCTSLTSVVIPRSVTTIDNSAFLSCFALDSLIILPGVTSIGSSAFSICSSLTSVVIPNSVTEIGTSAFAGCRLLSSVTIPDSVLSIGNGAFSDCDSLTDIYCGFAENAVPGAPWGAPDTATIHYNA